MAGRRTHGSTSAALQVHAQVLPLHSGEVAALRVAVGHPGAILLTDDAAARLAARSLDIRVHGTLGILAAVDTPPETLQRPSRGAARRLPHRSTLHVKAGLLEDYIRAVEQVGDE